MSSDSTQNKEVPSVTKLLNRKKLAISDSSESGLFKRSPTPSSTRSPGPSLSHSSSSGPSAQLEVSPGSMDVVLETHNVPVQEFNAPTAFAHPKIRTASLSTRKGAPLQEWSSETLKTGSDPLAQVLSKLIQIGAVDALFLAAHSSVKGIEFKSSAILADKSRSKIWEGITWSPAQSPQAWNTFVKDGFVEVAPLAPVGPSTKGFPRSAFGLENGEWLHIVRCGPVSACRGLLLVTAKKSLAPEIRSLLALLGAVFKAAPTAKAA